MAIVNAAGDPGDGSLVADSWKHEGGVVNANLNFQSDAMGGENAKIENLAEPLSGQTHVIGGEMWNGATQANRREAFIAFTPQTGAIVPNGLGEMELVNAAIRHGRESYRHDGAPFPDDSIRWYIRPWASPVTASAWVNLNGLQGANTPDFETKNWLMDRADGLYEVSARRMFADALEKLSNGGNLSYMITLTSATATWAETNKVYQGYLPTANNTNKLAHFRPTAVLRYVRRHALNHVLGASIQLTDGTAVFLRYDDTIQRVSLYYQKVSQTTPTLIAHLRSKTPTNDNTSGASQYFGIEPGNQTFAITRDDANNIYVIGSRGNEQSVEYNTQFFNMQCFRNNGDFTWTQVTQTSTGAMDGTSSSVISANDVHRGTANCFAVVWLPSSTGGNLGQVCKLSSRRDGQWAKYQFSVHSNYAGYLQAVSGAQPMYGYGAAGGLNPPVATWWRPWNSSGTGLDAFRDGNTIRYASFIQADPTNPNERSAAGSIDMPASGTPVGQSFTYATNTISTNTPHDPDAKIRAVWLGDQSPHYGVARHGHFQVINKADGALIRNVDFSASNLAGFNFPSRADLQKSAAWDIIWINGSTNVAVYYKDSNNSRIIKRFLYDWVSNLVTPVENVTETPIGDSGADIIAIRLPRQQTDVRCILIDVAMQLGDGSIAGLITLRDTSLDIPPLAPIISNIDQFNASGTKAIEWLFRDQNANDFATFQDVEIRNLSTGVTAHFVNHVTAVAVDLAARLYRYTIGSSVLTNDTQYQIRIRSYDSVDVVGEWSDWRNFATTATGGVVTIVDPAADLEPLNRSTLLVKWTYVNTGDPEIVQTGYRVRVYNDDSGALASDSGVQTSTATEHQITGLISDIRYRVEVVIVDSAAQTSGAGSRLIFPDFNNPSVPHVDLEVDPGVIRVRCTNPPPDGENPVTIENQIARKETEADDENYVVVGTCPPDGVFADWTVASGTSYTYKARGRS
jgi:hypothetical protein